MPLLSKDQILKLDDLKRETVTVPEWGGDVVVRAMTGLERGEWTEKVRAAAKGKPLPADLGARVVAWCALNSAGERMFKDSEIPALANKASSAIERLYDAIWRLSGLGESGLEAAKGNSEPTPSVG